MSTRRTPRAQPQRDYPEDGYLTLKIKHQIQHAIQQYLFQQKSHPYLNHSCFKNKYNVQELQHIFAEGSDDDLLFLYCKLNYLYKMGCSGASHFETLNQDLILTMVEDFKEHYILKRLGVRLNVDRKTTIMDILNLEQRVARLQQQKCLKNLTLGYRQLQTELQHHCPLK